MFVRQNLVSGTLTAVISDVDTSFSSVELAELVAVSAPDKVRVVLDPLGDDAGPEIIDITAHTANSMSATVVRAVEDSARFPAVEHPIGTRWIVADTVETLPFQASGTQVYVGARDLVNDVGQAVVSGDVTQIVKLTQTEYDQIVEPDSNVLYLVVNEEGS